jgi:hypothetical protein
MGDRGHPHRHVEVFQRDIAVALSERPFGLKPVGVNEALDNDFDVGGDVQVDGERLGGAPAKPPATAISS